jgi:hypothetical protein
LGPLLFAAFINDLSEGIDIPFLTTDSLLDGVYAIALSVCVCVSLNTSHLPPVGQIPFKLEEIVLGF